MLKDWVRQLKNRNDWSWTSFYKTDLTEEDLPHVDLVPFFSYRLEYEDLRKFNINSKIEDLIHLNKSQVKYFVMKNSYFVAIVDARFENGIYIPDGFSGIPAIQINPINPTYKKSNSFSH